MSKSILSKVAAVACSVASVIALGVCASAEKLEVTDANYGLDASKVNIVATQVKLTESELAAASNKVQYDVEIAHNTGFAGCGVRLVYPKSANLTIVPNKKGKPGTVGPVAQSLMAHVTENTDVEDDPNVSNVAIGCAATENGEDDGVFFTVEFELPSTAKAGTKIPLTLEVDSFRDELTHNVAYKTVDGFIEIVADPTVETTPAPVTSTQAPATTTAPVTTVTEAVKPATTAPVTSTAPAPTTTITQAPTGGTTTAAPATTTAAPATAGAKATTAGTAANGNKNTTKAGATQTGDTGAGVAVAALLLAAGTAVAAAKKKED